MRFLLTAVVIAASLVSASSVHAQGSASRDAQIAQAKKEFASGNSAYHNGDFEVALAHFRRAYELTKSPDLLYNIATVSDRMRHDAEALEAYEGYIEARPASPDREHVEGRIEALREAIRAQQQAEVAAQMEARRAAVEAAAKVKAERPLTRHVGPGPGPWITIGAGSASMVTGAILVGLGQRDQKNVSSAPPGSSFAEYQDIADRGPRRTKVGVALLGVGAAGVIGGGIWQLTGGHEEEVPEVSIGPTGISIRGKF